MSPQDTAPEPPSHGVDAIGRTIGRYLLAIHRHSDTATERVPSSELGQSLDVSAASVTEMTAKLDTQGLVEYEKYQGVRLTDDGAHLARQLAWRRCVVTNFFESVLNADLDTETAYQIGFTLPLDGLTELRERIEPRCLDACPEPTQTSPDCSGDTSQHERMRVNM